MEKRVEYDTEPVEQEPTTLELELEADAEMLEQMPDDGWQEKEAPKPEDVDMSQLAKVMLLWEEKQREADLMKDWIEAQALILQDTVTVGYVRVTYAQPRKSYDYETPCRELLEDKEHGFWVERAMREHTKEVIDWRKVSKAEYVEVEPIVTEGEGPGKATVKLLR